MSDDEQQEIKDLENHVNQRRIEQVLDIRSQLHDARSKIRTARNTFRALKVYRSLLESYIIETEPLLRQYGGNDLLEERHFTTVVVESPVHPDQSSQIEQLVIDAPDGHWQEHYYPENPDDAPESIEIEIIGLDSVLSLPNPIYHQFSIQTVKNGLVEHTEKTQIPFRELDTMARSVNCFLADIGFEMEPSNEPEDGFLDL
jgi:hypothetical protein